MTDNPEQLRAFIERAERMNAEIKDKQDDRKEIFAEAKSAGFDVKTLKTIIRRRAQDRATVEEADALLEIYEAEMGA